MKIRFIILAISLSLFAMTIGCSKTGGDKQESTENLIPVEVTTVKSGKIEKTLHFIGNVEAVKKANIFSKIPDHIVKLYVDAGSFVEEGDTLAIIENEKIRQSVVQAQAGKESAQAQYNNALNEWKRIKNLYDNNAISKSQFEAVNTQLEAAKSALKQVEAALKTARSQLSDTYIISPFKGIISERNVEEGDIATPQIPLFRLVSMQEVKVMIDVIERELGMIKPGQKAHIHVSSYPGVIFEGVVFRVYPTLNPVTRTAKTEIRVSNKDFRLKPGMFAKVEIVIESKESVPLIPKDAILRNTQLKYDVEGISTDEVYIRKYVYVVHGDIVEKREIKTGIETDKESEVVQGLKPGDMVVTVGAQNLSDSSKVSIIGKG